MKKKTLTWKRATALATGTLLLAATAAGGIAALPASAASYANAYSLDVAKAFQEFDGWGLSLSWWATEIGDWTRKGPTGMQKREEVMEAIYGKSGLNLNIARYNVGGGDDPTHTHMTDDRNTPGWRGATKTTAEDEEGNEYTTYTANENYYFTESDGSTVDWQDTPDWRQLWVLDWIQSNRDDVLTEYYSNSPPYWMTTSGCSSGGVKEEGDLKDNLYGSDKYGKTDRGLPNENLPEGNNQLFVEYLLDVYEYLTSQGFTFENIQPFNESSSNYWYWGANGDQEGCHFSAQQQIEILHLLDLEMQKRGIDAAYNFGDETNTGYATDQYKRARRETTSDGTSGVDVVNGAGRLTYHIYSYDINRAQQMYRNAHQNGQEIYMSEICFTEGDEYDPDAMATGFKYTQSIIDTVKYGGVDAYVFWQGVEDMVGQIKSGTNYGLIQGVYYTQEEAEAQGTDLAAMGLNYQDFVLSKAYYMSGQYTKYINKGYTIVDISDDGSMAAISPDGETLVVVKQNKGNNAESFKLDLGGFKAGSVEKIYTDKTHNWARKAISTDGDSIIDTVSESSVTTYVIHGARTGRAGHFIDDSWADTSYTTLGQIQAKLDELGETEQIYGNYSIAQHDCNKNVYFGTSYDIQGMFIAFRFKGIGFDIPATQKSDSGVLAIWIDKPLSGEPTTRVDMYSASQKLKSIVYSTTDLEDDWHTVYIRLEKGTGARPDDVLKDEDGKEKNQYFNFDGVFVYSAKDAAASDDVLKITDAAGLNGQIRLEYTATGYDGYEIFAETRTNGGDWVRGETALTGGSAMLNADAQTVELRLAAVKEEDERFSPVTVVNVLTATDGVLYFVDCGTATPDELSTGAVLGELQSASDKAFGEDSFSGASWGYTNRITGATGYNGSDEAMTSVMSADMIPEGKAGAIEYQFTIPTAGTYRVTLGFFGGGSSWGTRQQEVTVGDHTEDVEVAELTYNALYTTVNASANETLIITVRSKTKDQGALLSAIVITEENVKLPLYASAASSYNTQTATVATEVAIGGDLYEEVSKANYTVYFSDGTNQEIGATDTGVSCSVATNNIVAGGSVTATFRTEGIPGLETYVNYTWMQEGAEQLYYNIDIGFETDSNTPPDDATELGSKQSTTRDQEYHADTSKGTSWGRTSAAGDLSYENNGSNAWSIRGNINDLTYKMTGFKANEALKIETGGHLYENWGPRAYNVVCNDTVVGNINMTIDHQNSHFYEQFDCVANQNGELEVKYTRTSGGNPWVGYIKVWSAGDSLPEDTEIAADKTTVSRADTINLRNLNTAATVYVLDENGAILDNFKPAGATAEVKVSDYLPETSYELHFVQATANVTNVSAELVVDVPDIDVIVTDEWTKGGMAATMLFKPHAAHGVTALTVTTPYNVTANLTDGFFFRATVNGNYTVKLISNGVTVEKTIHLSKIDNVKFNSTLSTTDWTTEAVTVTLKPEAASGIVSVTANGEPLTDTEGVYTFTATENGEYHVTITTEAGFEYGETVEITNIDKSEPEVELNLDFSATAGVALDYNAISVSGGKLFVAYNGGEKTEVTESGAFSLDREGKYEITFTSGTGKTTQKQVYYVTYGAEKANLANVTVGADGTVTVTAKARTDVSAKLYRSGESTAIESLKAEKAGKYYLEIENAGEKEVVVFNVAAESVNGTGIVDETNSAGGSVGGMVAGIVIGCAAMIAAGVVCTLLILKGRKQQ